MKFYTSWHPVNLFLFNDLVFSVNMLTSEMLSVMKILLNVTENPSLA